MIILLQGTNETNHNMVNPGNVLMRAEGFQCTRVRGSNAA